MELKLPQTIVGYADITRVIRLLSSREELFITAAAKKQVLSQPDDKALLDLANLNKVDLMDQAVCRQLREALQKLVPQMPKFHISFAVEPSSQVTETIVTWLRSNIHPAALLGVGLQPTIGAGCILRTPNRVFDLSLKSYINRQDEFLLQLIKGAVSGN